MSHRAVEILLVEDNPADVELMMHAFRKQNFANNIQVARDGEEALDFVFRRGLFAQRNPNDQPKLVLLDLKLPKISGLEVLRELKNDPVTQAIPVVVLTTSKEDGDVSASYKLGANSYLQKPVEFGEFLKMVTQIGFYWLVVNQPQQGETVPGPAAGASPRSGMKYAG